MSKNFNIPKIELSGYVRNMDNVRSMPPLELGSIDTPKANFKEVVSNLADGLNQQLNAPEKLLKSAMSGDSDVDIHDVMTAMSKADLTVSVATQVTGKVIQAYEKIMQISV